MVEQMVVKVRWPESGEFGEAEISVRCVPRQSDVIWVGGNWLRVSNVMMYPYTVVYAHKIATELEEEMSLMNSFGIDVSEANARHEVPNA